MPWNFECFSILNFGFESRHLYTSPDSFSLICFVIAIAISQINLAANSAVKALERPNLLSPQELQASFDDQFHKFVSAIQKPEFNLFAIKGNSTLHAIDSSSHPHTGSSESQMAGTT